MNTLLDVLQVTENRRVSVGHFNVSDLTVLKAVGEAARELACSLLIFPEGRYKMRSKAAPLLGASAPERIGRGSWWLWRREIDARL